jgi:hypothetical protein
MVFLSEWIFQKIQNWVLKLRSQADLALFREPDGFGQNRPFRQNKSHPRFGWLISLGFGPQAGPVQARYWLAWVEKPSPANPV